MVYYLLKAQLRPDYDNLATFIFVTENWDTCEKLIIFIHGSGKVKAGQWTQKYDESHPYLFKCCSLKQIPYELLSIINSLYRRL